MTISSIITKDIDDLGIEASPLEPLGTMVFTPPIPPKERTKYSPMVWELDGKLRIRRLACYALQSYPTVDFSLMDKEVRTWQNVMDFLLDAGTAYIPCKSNFLSIFGCYFSEVDQITLGREKPIKKEGYTISLSKSVLTIRKGNRHARVYSFWSIFPKYVTDVLDEWSPMPLSLIDFTQIFILVLSSLHKEGFTICTLHSSASIVASNLLSGSSIKMFGGLRDLPQKVLEDAHQCYIGHRFECFSHGGSEGDYWDIIRAFPYEAGNLISAKASNMRWVDVDGLPQDEARILLDNAFYAFLYCTVDPLPSLNFSPVILRFESRLGYALTGLLGKQTIPLTLPEYQLLVNTGVAKVTIRGGSIGLPIGDIGKRFKGPMEKLFRLSKDPLLGNCMKSASQVITGKMASTYKAIVTELAPDWSSLEEVRVTKASPLFNVIYASHINGAVRAKMVYYTLKYNASSIRADGGKFPTGTKVEEEGEEMGALKRKASGLLLNPNDMVYAGPEDSELLERLLDLPETSQTFPETSHWIHTFAGELKRGKSFKRVGSVSVRISNRHFGSSKRIPLNLPNKKNFFGPGINHRPGKNLEDLYHIRHLQSRMGEYGHS